MEIAGSFRVATIHLSNENDSTRARACVCAAADRYAQADSARGIEALSARKISITRSETQYRVT